MLRKQISSFNSLIIYWSGTGNTEKVANAIRKGIERLGLKPTIIKDCGC